MMAPRAAFITGQSPMRTGLLKVGLPGAKEGLSDKDPTLAELLKPRGYTTGQFGKPGRPQRVYPDRPRLRRVLRQSLSLECRGRARAPRLSEGAGVPPALRPARRAPVLRDRPGRLHGGPSFWTDGPATLRRHRAAHHAADGDGGSGIPDRHAGLH